ncbi:unnamed protein product [Pleuronectes platessa]|uniref:Uncharacterized protein n=1 Tax=Pleuronectes platessa TaxID=8262 RepID=A0A9N7TX26_PLEPL|nr:unnamed protein product [Pleuronectes platessa]
MRKLDTDHDDDPARPRLLSVLSISRTVSPSSAAHSHNPRPGILVPKKKTLNLLQHCRPGQSYACTDEQFWRLETAERCAVWDRRLPGADAALSIRPCAQPARRDACMAAG